MERIWLQGITSGLFAARARRNRGDVTALGALAAFLAWACWMPQANADTDSLVRQNLENTPGSIALRFAIQGDMAIEKRAAGLQDVSLPGFSSGGRAGDPRLPLRRLQFLLPEDVAWDTVTVTLENAVWEEVSGKFDLAPCPPAATMDHNGKAVVAWPGKNANAIVNGRDVGVYETAALFPAVPVKLGSPSRYRCWNVCEVDLCAAAYNPPEKTLSLLRSGMIRITFGETNSQAKSSSAGHRQSHDAFWPNLAEELENPQNRSVFYPEVPAKNDPAMSAATAEYVIITTSAIKTASTMLNAFVTHKQTAGFTVAVITEGTSAGDSTYVAGSSASTRAANIRNWLKDHYASWGIQHVLMVGNPHPTSFDTAASIPMLMCYPFDGTVTEYATPTDLCYAELSGSWDLDADGYPGEFYDDIGAGGIDSNPEVAVGRIPYYGTIEHVDSILQKVIAYETTLTDISWRQKVLIPAAVSNFVEDEDNDSSPEKSTPCFGDDFGEEVKALASLYGYAPYTLYEKSGCYDDGSAYPLTECDAPVTLDNVKAEWQRAYGFVTWWGHGSEQGAYRKVWVNDAFIQDGICQVNSETSWEYLWNSDSCSQLPNNYPSFVFQVSCTNGYPEDSENLGYSLLKRGALGTVSASRVSWYAVATWYPFFGPNVGDNASYAYYGFQYMTTELKPIGEALNCCKRDFGVLWEGYSWMNKLDFNLYGDPSASQETWGVGALAVQFSTPEVSACEGALGTPVLVRLSSTPHEGTVVSVAYSTSGGTAKPGQDYVATSGVLEFTGSETSKPFAVTFVDDTESEDNETIVLTLSNPVNCVLGPLSTSRVVILDDERDSDGDRLSDYYETTGAYGYFTDPYDADTDDDGHEDGTEIFAGTDPTDPTSYPIWRVDIDNVSGTKDGKTWATAFTSIQNAVNEAATMGSGEVWVAKGTYTSTSNPAVTMREKVDLYGGFVGIGSGGNETLLTQRNWQDNRTVIDGEEGRTCVSGANNAILDGFMVVRGSSGTNWGGGMDNEYASPTVRNCIFADNSCSGTWPSAGGMYNLNASPTVENCAFVGNRGENTGLGGAMANSAGSSPVLIECVFQGNTSIDVGGAVFSTQSSCQFIRCKFVNNSAQGAGGALYNRWGTSVSLTDCLFVRNQADTGGAICTADSDDVLNATNCTFMYDSVEYHGIIDIFAGAATVQNCVLWSDSDVPIFNLDGTLTVTFSDVAGGCVGQGNTNANPLFAIPLRGTWTNTAYDPKSFTTTFTINGADFAPGALSGKTFWHNGSVFYIVNNDATHVEVYGDVSTSGNEYEIRDWHLRRTSPCVDTGSNSGAPATDLDGQARPVNGTVDMGVDEYAFSLNDSDQDGTPDATDLDDDGDGVPDAHDTAPYDAPPYIYPTVSDMVMDEDTPASQYIGLYGTDDEDPASALRWFVGNIDRDLLAAEIDAATQTLIVTPVANASGTDDIALLLVDSKNQSMRRLITVTVNPVNDPPQVAILPAQTFRSDAQSAPLELDGYVSDVDNADSALTWAYSGNSNVIVTFDPLVRTIVFSTTGGWTGSETITFRATDPDGLHAEQDIVVQALAPNSPPWIEPSIPAIEMEDVTPFTCDLSAYANDADDDKAALTWSVSGANTALFDAAIDVTGTILTLTPVTGASGNDTIELTLQDAAGATASQEVLVTVTLSTPPGGPEDVDGSGEVDALDVQLVINTALGSGASPLCDVNDDGEINALDVQRTINAALGLR